MWSVISLGTATMGGFVFQLLQVCGTSLNFRREFGTVHHLCTSFGKDFYMGLQISS
jgi:hypothetical protein